MKKAVIGIIAFLISLSIYADVLIVADEIPAMEYLAGYLKKEENINSKIVTQQQMPSDLSNCEAVIVYIHRNLNADAEEAFINYTKKGGKLIPLHHSISSGKRKNKHWFTFLGVDLPEGDVEKGGYKWIEGVTIDIVCLERHFITTNKINFNEKTLFKTDSQEKELPGFRLTDTEVYLNHKLLEPRMVLLGFKYTDAKTGKVYMQNHASWLRKYEEGLIIYLQPGHSVKDFQNPIFSRMIANAVIYKK